MAKIYARSNHIGWVHLWSTVEAFDQGEPSEHFFNGRTDSRWAALLLDDAQKAALARGELIEIEDPGYLG